MRCRDRSRRRATARRMASGCLGSSDNRDRSELRADARDLLFPADSRLRMSWNTASPSPRLTIRDWERHVHIPTSSARARAARYWIRSERHMRCPDQALASKLVSGDIRRAGKRYCSRRSSRRPTPRSSTSLASSRRPQPPSFGVHPFRAGFRAILFCSLSRWPTCLRVRFGWHHQIVFLLIIFSLLL